MDEFIVHKVFRILKKLEIESGNVDIYKNDSFQDVNVCNIILYYSKKINQYDNLRNEFISFPYTDRLRRAYALSQYNTCILQPLMKETNDAIILSFTHDLFRHRFDT
jgi:hypothetical protein